MPRRVWVHALAFLSLILVSSEGKALAGESYYVMIFGSESSPKQLRRTHTWATYIRAVGDGADPDQHALEAHTISWLPATHVVRVWRARPEPGDNLSLEETLQTVASQGESVTMWGPFVIGREVYERSLGVRRILESGIAQYRAISTPRNLLISDCIHAVAATDPIFGRQHYPLVRIGKPASRYIARQVMMRSQFDQWQYDNSWLIPRLGLDRYPIEIVSPQRIPKATCGLCLQQD